MIIEVSSGRRKMIKRDLIYIYEACPNGKYVNKTCF